ncbi:MAG: hypothetical protein ACREMQ_09680 [Longimicrobiales bacterium]
MRCAWPAHAGDDVKEGIRSAVRAAVPSGRAAEIIAFEVAVMWYALLWWRARSATGEGAGSFTYHRKTGYGAVVAALLLALAVEITPIHALLARWSATFAWIVTALSLYGVLWLIGDLRAIQLRPIVLRSDRLIVRFGLRWTLTVPLRQIESVRLIGGAIVHDRMDLRLALPGARRLSILLKEPVEASGVYGLRRRVQAFELGVDDPERLLKTLAL